MANFLSTFGVKLDASGVQKGAKQVQASVDGMSRNVRAQQTKMAGGFDRLKKSIFSMKGAIVGIGGALLFKATIGQAVEFETAMKEVSTLLSGDAKNSVDGMTDSVRALSAEFGSNRLEQAKGLYQAISAGAEPGAQAIEVLTAANKLAVGGVTDVETAVDGLTTAMNVYGATGLTAGEASDALFVAMKAGKTTVGELSASLGKVIPLAVSAGLSFDESAAAVAALTKAGISTRESVTGLRAILAAVAKPSSEAAELAEKLGINFSVSGLKAQGFAGFMAEVSEKTGRSTEQIAQLFGGVEAIIPALNFAGEAGKSFNEIMEDMENKTGATQEAFDAMSKTAGFALGRMKQALSRVFEALGAEGLGAVTAFSGAVVSMSDVIIQNTDLIVNLAKLLGTGGAFYIALVALPAVVEIAAISVAGLTGAFIALKASLTGIALTSLPAFMGGLALSTPVTLQAAKAVGVMASALSLLSVAMVGVLAFQFGKLLHDEFEIVRVAGVGMTTALLTAWANLKYSITIVTLTIVEKWNFALNNMRESLAQFLLISSKYTPFLSDETVDDMVSSAKALRAAVAGSNSAIKTSTAEATAERDKAIASIKDFADAQADSIKGYTGIQGAALPVKDLIKDSADETNKATMRNEEFTDAITDLIEKLKEENEVLGLSDRAILQRTLDLNQATEAEKNNALALFDSTVARQANIDAMKQEKDAKDALMKEGANVSAGLLTPTEEFNKALERTQLLYDNNAISAIELTKRNAQLKDEFQKVQDKAKGTDSTMKDLGATFSSAFEDAILKGEDFRGVLQGIFDDIARILLRKTVTDPIAEAVGGFDFKGFLGGLFTGGVSAPAAGVTALGGAGLKTSLLGIGGKRAMGGPVDAGTSYLVGEKGPEVIVPRQSGNVIPNNKLGGGDINIQIVVNAETGSTQQQGNDSEGKANALGRQLSNMVAQEIMKHKRTGGLLAS